MNYKDVTPGEQQAYRQGHSDGSRDGYDSGYTDGENAAIDWSYDSGYQEGFLEGSDVILDAAFAVVIDMIQSGVPYTAANKDFLRAIRYVEGPKLNDVTEQLREIQRAVNEKVVA